MTRSAESQINDHKRRIDKRTEQLLLSGELRFGEDWVAQYESLERCRKKIEGLEKKRKLSVDENMTRKLDNRRFHHLLQITVETKVSQTVHGLRNQLRSLEAKEANAYRIMERRVQPKWKQLSKDRKKLGKFCKSIATLQWVNTWKRITDDMAHANEKDTSNNISS